MSLTKLLRAPVKLFRKDVITFLIIRRHDLGILEEKLRYVAVKPTASISVLRQKVWHLLDLPDYCEEAIVLKVDENTEIPLTHLRKGNDPQHPYILEVWLPDSRLQSSPSMRNNMLTMGTGESCASDNLSSKCSSDNKQDVNHSTKNAISNATIALNAFRFQDNKCLNLLHSDYKKSDVSCRISSTSMFKLGKKNKDSFTNILLKIQSDLCTLSNKLSNLENRIPL